ncbi:MAG: response regulator transcription factor [Bryobacteraceae bacterium]|nr:response regulator transcription factor [Bryobacteraceae bacterium]MDW8378541.1 response regulator transcription factor [Bryobacterales bacterium]
MQETITVGACETQPLLAIGLASVLAEQPGYEFVGAVQRLEEASVLTRSIRPRVMILDKTFGVQAVLEWIANHKPLTSVPVNERQAGPAIVVWGFSLSEAETLRFLQVGAKGILRKTADPAKLLACLQAVASRTSWIEDSLFRETIRPERPHRSELTPREQQVMQLVEQGLKNKEIARQLGIRPGTVKIHLKHIFEKTGIRGRYGLALSGMKDKGIFATL